MAKASFTLSFSIAPAAGGGGSEPIVAAKTSFTGTVGEPLNDDVGLSGGSGPLSLNVPDPTQLPPGVSLDATGKVSGVPTQDGTFSVGIDVSDSQG